MKKTRLKVIALDFDGTLVESNNIKDRAFEIIFSEWPRYTERMMKWHLMHNTRERKEKFRFPLCRNKKSPNYVYIRRGRGSRGLARTGITEGTVRGRQLALRPTPGGQRIQPRFARGEERNKIAV